MFQQWQETMERLTKDWEQATSLWWEQTLQDPKTLESLGSFLNGACAAKERTDRAMEEHWARWRLPSAGDIERVYERLGEIQDSLGLLQERLSELEAKQPTQPAPAKKKTSSRKASK